MRADDPEFDSEERIEDICRFALDPDNRLEPGEDMPRPDKPKETKEPREPKRHAMIETSGSARLQFVRMDYEAGRFVCRWKRK